MRRQQSNNAYFLLLIFFLSVTGDVTGGTTLDTDKQVLLQLKGYLQDKNRINQGAYAKWNGSDPDPCRWKGITCEGGRVTRLDLSSSFIASPVFSNLSALAALTHLDLSKNTISGSLSSDLNRCTQLRYLNLSHNIINGSLDLPDLSKLEVLDVTLNRFTGSIARNFPGICGHLVTLNVSMNNFTGDITNVFDSCPSLKYVDLSTNHFEGELLPGMSSLIELSVSENKLTGEISEELFAVNCSLEVLDLSENRLGGRLPGSILNCGMLRNLNLMSNQFVGAIPSSIGFLSELNGLYLGKNKFDRNISESLLNCSKLMFLDLSGNAFGGDVQPIFGRFKQLKFLVLHDNQYQGGIEESGILKLPNLKRLDLSNNNFRGGLPVGVVNMTELRFLILANNTFSGPIPQEYGNMSNLQALDISFNQLSGKIPKSIGNLKFLLWLMLGNNSLSGEIPPEIGNCKSLLWLNLANNSLTGSIPPALADIGRDPSETFRVNSKDNNISSRVGSGECLTMRRWIPATYPPFSFIYTIMTPKVCRTTWSRLRRGIGIFPVCSKNGSSVSESLSIFGYVQLSGNKLTGQIPNEIGRMNNFTLILLDQNNLTGPLPPEIAKVPLVVLNVSHNNLSGSIPTDIGSIKCLRILDLSYNNFSGMFPNTIGNLYQLSEFNVSYNPHLTGTISLAGQMATFGEDSFIGDPFIQFYAKGDRTNQQASNQQYTNSRPRMVPFYIFLGVCISLLAIGTFIAVLCVLPGFRPAPPPHNLDFLQDIESKPVATKGYQSPSLSTVNSSTSAASSSTSTVTVKIFNHPKFTYHDVIHATRGFTDDAVIGRGGFGTVYRGTLPDGREVAVKKLQGEGMDGISAELEVLNGREPHPNLVPLHGWCFGASENILVYEYMEGGSLEEVVSDWGRLDWEKRIAIAEGVARALVFLHHECVPPVVHRDVKASNVLLDGKGNARLTDFGLARVVRPEETHVSTMVAGTVGYVAPEYGQTWQATRKGDVYSFGVLTMELATGRRAVDGGEEDEYCSLVEWVRRKVGVEGLSLDDDLVGFGGGGGRTEMTELLKVGMRCTTEAPQGRPEMREVLQMLRSIVCK